MSHDLRQLFRAVGRFSGQQALTSSPPDRQDIDGAVELLDEDPGDLSGVAPAPVGAWVDGIQASMILTHRAHRPVYLSYVAAGAVGNDRQPVTVREKLEIVCSHLDREWVDELGSSVPVDEHTVESPPDVERAALDALGGHRAALEVALAQDLVVRLESEPRPVVVVDGSLGPRIDHMNLAGVVKTHGRKYLPDETVLYGLPAGWRSPRFKIPAGVAGGRSERWSCYVRLSDASDHAWAHALIRVETHRLDLLESMAARCLTEKQPSRADDARVDRHLAPVRRCEDWLRARRPQVYGVSG